MGNLFSWFNGGDNSMEIPEPDLSLMSLDRQFGYGDGTDNEGIFSGGSDADGELSEEENEESFDNGHNSSSSGVAGDIDTNSGEEGSDIEVIAIVPPRDVSPATCHTVSSTSAVGNGSLRGSSEELFHDADNGMVDVDVVTHDGMKDEVESGIDTSSPTSSPGVLQGSSMAHAPAPTTAVRLRRSERIKLLLVNKVPSEKALLQLLREESKMSSTRTSLESNKEVRRSTKKSPKKDVQRRNRAGNRKQLTNCQICQKLLSTKAAAILHASVHVADRPFKCTVCSKEYKREKWLIRHLRSVHR